MTIVYGTGTVIARQAHAHNRHGGPFESCRRCRPAESRAPLFRPRFRWVPGRVDPVPVIDFGGGAPWVLHHSPLVHEVVPAAVPGHSCPAGCQKIAEIEAFLEWYARG